jgi:5-methylcytosine-specific restriction endonuclease McrA
MKYRRQRTERNVTAGAMPSRRRTGTTPTGFTNRDVRHGSAWRQLAHRFKLACAAEQAVCWHCRQPINYHAPTRTADSFEADHVVSVRANPGLALQVSNLRPAHARCNQARIDECRPPR